MLTGYMIAYLDIWKTLELEISTLEHPRLEISTLEHPRAGRNLEAADREPLE